MQNAVSHRESTHVASRASNLAKAKALAKRIATQVKRATGKGLPAASIFIVARIKETLNVPAPKKRVVSHITGNVYYKVLEPATKGAPMRKVSGEAQRRVEAKVVPNGIRITNTAQGRPPRRFKYPGYHELKGLGRMSGRHPWVRPTVKRYTKELKKILSRSFKIEFGKK